MALAPCEGVPSGLAFSQDGKTIGCGQSGRMPVLHACNGEFDPVMEADIGVNEVVKRLAHL